MVRILTALALTVGATALAVSAPTAPAGAADRPPPGVGIRLVDVPVATAADPRARSYIIDHVAPGTVIRRRVEVSNGTRTTARVSVYAGAAQIRGGAFSGAEGHTRNDLATWITLAPPAPVLGPQQRTLVNVTIRVPPRASRGERYGVVWAEVTNVPPNGGVTRVNRVGIRLYLDVGPGGAPRSDFTITSLTAERDAHGTPLLQATVRNTGERALDLKARLKLSNGPGGLSAGPVTGKDSTTLGLGQSAPVTVALDKALPRGPWLARVTVSSGLDKRAAQATVIFPADAGKAAPVPVESAGIPWWAWAVGLVLLLAALLIASAAVLRRRSTRRHDEWSPAEWCTTYLSERVPRTYPRPPGGSFE